MVITHWTDPEEDCSPKLPEPLGPPAPTADHPLAPFYRRPRTIHGQSTGFPEAANAGRYR